MTEEKITCKGYIGRAGELFVVEEWERITFKNTNGKKSLIVDGEKQKDFSRNTDSDITYTFQNRLGYADVEIDGEKLRLLVVSYKVFDQEWLQKFLSSESSGSESKEKDLCEKLKEKCRKNDNCDSLVKEFNRIFQAYLHDLYWRATSLPFEIESETHWPGEIGFAPADPFWRLVFLKNRGMEIRDALRFIMARPHSSLVGEQRWARPERVRRFSPNALVSALTKPGNLLADDPAFLRFPDITPRPSFDNPENRFVRFAVEAWLNDLVALKHILGKECEAISNLADSLTEALFSVPLSEAGPFKGIPSTSTVLAKAPGYRDIRRLWAEYQRDMTILPDLEKAISLRRIDVIWEYWVLFELMEALHDALGGGTEKWSVNVKGDFQKGQGSLIFEKDKVKLRYNQPERGYSNIRLRPDFLLEINGHRFVFDAKFRLDWKDIEEFTKQKGASAEYTDALEDAKGDHQALAKAADIVKMHAYRDAIEGVQGAFVLYPGTENRQMTVAGDRCETSLESFLKKITLCPFSFRGVGYFGVKRQALNPLDR